MATSRAPIPRLDPSRLKKLQIVGVMCGLAAGAWLGAAEAPTKLVRAGISPVVISLVMVIGVFLALLLNQRVRGMYLFRTILFLPSVLSGVAVAALWVSLLNPDLGVVK